MNLRKLWLKLHRYVAFVAGGFLVLLGLSGSILVFEDNIDRLLHPQLWTVAVRGERLSYQAILEKAQAVYPGRKIGSLRPPDHPRQSVELTLAGGRLVYIDPYNGQPLGDRLREEMPGRYVHRFHTSLLLGRWGSVALGTSALALLPLAVSGSVLWWQTRRFRFGWSGSWKRLNYDAHNVIGLYAMPLWLIIGVTGAMIAFDDVAKSFVYWITRSQPTTTPAVVSTPVTDAKPIAVDRAIELAESALPGARISFISLPASPKAAIMVFLKFPEDRTPAGRSRVALDQYSGKVLWLQNTRDVSAGTWYLHRNRSIHTGDIFAWPTRLLAAVASFLLAAQVISGLVIWWKRARR